MSIIKSNLPVPMGNEPLPVSTFAPVDDELSSAGLSLTQLIAILRAHLKRSLLILACLIVASAFIISILPRSYVATATLIVNRTDQNPLASPDLPRGWDNTFIPTQLDLIRSPAVLQPVIDRLHLMSNPEFTRGYSGDPAVVREEVFSNLYDALTVFQGSGSELLYVSAAAKRPDEAAAIANVVAMEYLKLNRERIEEPAIQRAKVYSQELEQLRQQTVSAQESVAAFRQKHGMINLAPGSDDEAEAALNDLEQKLLAAENQERSIQAQLEARAWGTMTAGSNSTSDLASKLSADEAELARMRETLGRRHPAVLELQSQISATRHAIAAGLAAQLADAKKLVARYSAAVDAQRDQVLKRRRVQDEGTKLLLELQSAEATYKRALDGYPQIEFASSDGFSDVSLVSLAAPPVRAIKPNKLKYFLAACALSLGLAFGIPFGYELFVNRRLRCRDDFERHFGIPVLAQFDPLTGRGAG
ncbi:MAG TPA: hypothetical protein VJ738_08195 [Steroidobacteraceae bacterium]|nr:hypothetical protein [Steroidobacteraceae bacterium]